LSGRLTRWLLGLAGAAAIAAVSVAATLLWVAISGYAGGRPDAPLLNGLPPNWDLASQELTHRLAARFPVGTPARDAAAALAAQGFEPDGWSDLRPITAVVRRESEFPCRIRTRAEWRADEAGRLVWIRGLYREEGCL
jgi:hypothetical protein